MQTIRCTLVLLTLVSCTPVGELDDGAIENDDETLAFAPRFAIGDVVEVCASRLNQRSGPSTSYSILRSMPQGELVTILAEQNGWFRNDWDGRIGWSSGMYLCPHDSGGATNPGSALGSHQLTYYYISKESDYTGSDTYSIYTPSCSRISYVPRAFRSSIVLEGTGRLTDGRLVNYAGSCGCGYSPCFNVVDPATHPWGIGAAGRSLQPYRSIAVDRDLIDLGDHVYVQEFDGLVMPNGLAHDGCVSADDVGGAIDGRHIDWFVEDHAAYISLDGQLGLTSVHVFSGGTRCP